MNESLKAFLIGIVQGLTEFLPVSSSGHIELGQALLGFEANNEVAFSIIVHLATVLSTIIVFRKDIANLITSLFRFQWNEDTKFISYLLLSAIPVGLAGVFLKDEIESLFTGKLLLVGFMLIVTSLLLYSTTVIQPKKGKLTPLKVVLIGIAQAIAIFPGISRSGATISTALNLGISREQAARFSFLMVLLPIIGASLLELKDLVEQTDIVTSSYTNAKVRISTLPLVFGFIGAFISGLIACTWMLNIVKKGKIQYFAYYCFIIGLLTIFLSWK